MMNSRIMFGIAFVLVMLSFASVQAAGVYITPDPAYDNDDIVCVIQEATDPSLFMFEWYVNGALYKYGYGVDTVYSTQTTPGQTWRCVGEKPVLSGGFTMIGEDSITIQASSVNNPPYQPYSPNPYSGAAGVSVNAYLSWTGGDPDGDGVTYDVYFQTGNSNPSMVSSGQSANSYSPGTMAYSATYYWKIVSRDSHGLTSTGPVWYFTTQSGSVNQPPVAVLTSDKTSVLVGEQVRFDGSGSYDNDGSVSQYYFDFGDGLNSGWIYSNYAYHSYSVQGTYYAKLRVKDNLGLESAWSSSRTIYVSQQQANHPPAASNVVISPGNPTDSSDLTCNYNYYDQDGDLESGTQIKWFRNGVQQAVTSKTLPNSYTSVGESWYCSVRPYDGKDYGSEVSSASVTIQGTTSNQPPAAVLTSDRTSVLVGEQVRFDGSGSYDNDGSISAYYFDFGDGQNSGWASSAVAYHSYSVQGTYYAKLRVKDNLGLESSFSSSRTIQVGQQANNNPPVISGIPDKYVQSGQTINQIDLWSYSSDTEDQDSSMAYSVDSQSNSQVISCYVTGNRYLACGQANIVGYSDITARVTDTGGLSDTASFRINVQSGSVNNPPHVFGITITPSQPNQLQSITCSASATDEDGNLNYMQFNWFKGSSLIRTQNVNLYGSSDQGHDTLPSGMTSSGDYIKCEARAYDAAGAYDTVSTTVRVGYLETNSAPSSANAEVTPRHPNTQQDLTCSGYFTDPDDNLAHVFFKWYVNDAVVRTITKPLSGSSATESDVLPHSSAYSGASVKCQVVVYDTKGLSDTETTLPVYVQSDGSGDGGGGTGYQIPVAVLSVNSYSVRTGETVTFSGTGSYDPDGSVSQYYFDYGDGYYSGWTSSAVAYHGYNTRGTYYARVKVKDNQGYESSWSGTMSVAVYSYNDQEPYYPPYYPPYNSGERRPTVDYVNIQPENPGPGQTITCTVTASDPDSDLNRIEVRWLVNGYRKRDLSSSVYDGYGQRSFTLNTYDFSAGDTVTCEARAYDYGGRSDFSQDSVYIRTDGYYQPYYPQYGSFCSASITKMEYTATVQEGSKASVDVSVENSGSMEGTAIIKVYAGGSLKGSQTEYLSRGETMNEKFEFSLPNGIYGLEVVASLPCGSEVKRYGTIAVGPGGDRTVTVPEESGQPAEQIPLNVVITPNFLDVELGTGKTLQIAISTPEKRDFTISVTGLPDGWVNYPASVAVDGKQTVYAYVVPKEYGNYVMNVKVASGSDKWEKSIKVYTAAQKSGGSQPDSGDSGLTGYFTANPVAVWLGIITLLLIVFVVVVFFARMHIRGSQSQTDTYYEEMKKHYENRHY